MNMNIYYNETYNAPDIEFETFEKSRYIADAVNKLVFDGTTHSLRIKDPSEVGGALQNADRLMRNHLTPEYYRAVLIGEPRSLAASNDLGWNRGVYDSVLNSTAGIICAIDEVLGEAEQSCSLSSGLHHARPNTGAFFCTVNSLAIGALYASSMAKRTVVLDLDAHFGGGTYVYAKSASHPFGIVDMSISDLDSYDPHPSIGIAIKANKNNYESQLSDMLDILEAERPEIVLYNAGVDVYPTLTAEQVVARELRVARKIREIGAKAVVVMAGGYGEYENIIPLHLSTILAFAEPEMLESGLVVSR